MRNQKVGIVPKIFLSIGMVIIFVIGGIYFYEMSLGELSFFTQHFTMGIILFITGCIALTLSFYARKSLSGDDRGDNLMIVVGIALMVCAVIAVISSFM